MADTTKVPKTLLLADASQTTRRIVELALADDDVRVVTADEGNRAIAAMSEAAPDLLLADAALPGMSGFAIAAYLRARAKLAHVPVLLLTGVLDAIDPVEAHRAGADGILTKPLDTAVLQARVRELLDTGRPAAITTAPAAPLRAGWGAAVLDGEAEAAPVPVETAVVELPVDVQTAPEPADTVPMPVDITPDDAPVEVPSWDTALGVSAPSATPDDYFDRIDQQFANLARTPRPPMPIEDEPIEDETIAPEPDPDPDDVVVADLRAVPPPPPVPPAATEPAAPVAAPAPVALTDAFAALLDAERTGGATAPLPPVRIAPASQPSTPAAAPSAPPIDLDRLAEQIAARVLSQLSDRIVRETVRDVVSTTTERLVREEIERIKRHIK